MTVRSQQEEEVTIGGQVYKIKKFTPETGSFWAFRLFGYMTTMRGLTDITQKIYEFTDMPKDKFKIFQQDCLSSVYAVLPAGNMPVINNEGNWGVQMDGPIAFELTLRSFMFSIMDFFAQDLLEGLLQDLLGGMSIPENINTPMNSSISQSDSGTGSNTNSGMGPTPSPIG